MRMSIKYLRTNENNEEDKQNQQNLKQVRRIDMTLYFTRYIVTPPKLIKLFCIPRFFFHKFNC